MNSGSWFGARDRMALAKYSWVKVCHFAVRPPVLIIVCFGYVWQEELVGGCGRQRHHVDELCAESSAGGHEDWGILARELRPSAHSPSLIRLSWCLLAPYINSLPIATLLSVLHVCRDRFEAFGGFRVTDWAAPSG